MEYLFVFQGIEYRRYVGRFFVCHTLKISRYTRYQVRIPSAVEQVCFPSVVEQVHVDLHSCIHVVHMHICAR